ncbi:uncharacterized protein LOC111626725 [Centruroides sculpturatus]|uniref:uncharacterized protein LOC111626725 n=1 Tax=Centruroides sculpturatus TaxID=218467 RepID=UPI000C6E933B|nr:uncharacterized protein LOC111626725 [Centruroides sculpturatus]
MDFYVLWLVFGFTFWTSVYSNICLPPVKPFGGYYSPSKIQYKENETISYSCYHSYYKFGKDKRKCLQDGTWDNEAAFCVKSLSLVYIDSQKVESNGNVSNCSINKTTFSLSFNYDRKYKSAIFRLHVLGKKPGDLQIFANNSNCNFNFVFFSNTSFLAECQLPLYRLPKKKLAEIVVVHLSENIQICTVQIFPVIDPVDYSCPLPTLKNATLLRYEPPMKTEIAIYGTAAIVLCNNSILDQQSVIYCGEDNAWIGRTCECM